MRTTAGITGITAVAVKDESGRGEKMKKVRQKYYMSSQLRLSVAAMVLWSFLAVGILNFMTIELGKKLDPSVTGIGQNIVIISMIFIAYISIFVLFIMRFSNRFIGPFERLKKEITAFINGKLHQRLAVRDNDDPYIRSFTETVNMVLEEYEKVSSAKDKLLRMMDEEVMHMMVEMEKEEFSRDNIRKALLLLSEKMRQTAK